MVKSQRRLLNRFPEIFIRGNIGAGIDFLEQDGRQRGVSDDFAELLVAVEDCCFVAWKGISSHHERLSVSEVNLLSEP